MKLTGAETRLALAKPQSGSEDRVGTFSQIVFTSDDVRATYEELRRWGVNFTKELEEQPWGAQAQFVDRDGSLFVLRSE